MYNIVVLLLTRMKMSTTSAAMILMKIRTVRVMITENELNGKVSEK